MYLLVKSSGVLDNNPCGSKIVTQTRLCILTETIVKRYRSVTVLKGFIGGVRFSCSEIKNAQNQFNIICDSFHDVIL